MTFIDLAERILQQSDHPLTYREIWDRAEQIGLTQRLNTKGKTPIASLSSAIYAELNKAAGKIELVGGKPKKYALKPPRYATPPVPVAQEPVTEVNTAKSQNILVRKKPSKPDYKELQLHAYLSRFAFQRLGCYTKTINHSTSTKKSYGEWIHPDIVGSVFPSADWSAEAVQLSKEMGNVSVKFLSFELKKEINRNSLRESFFQTVSNSSWANESYLVAAKISTKEDFQDELARLSSSFGIGIIKLDVNKPDAAQILYPARTKDQLDWDTINKLTMNRDFKEFLRRVKNDLSSHEIRKEWYDEVLSNEQLAKSLLD